MHPTIKSANFSIGVFAFCVFAALGGWVYSFYHIYNVGMSIDPIGWIAMTISISVPLVGFWTAKLLKKSVKMNNEMKVIS